MARRLVAELVGTFVLVFFAVGSAVFGLDDVGPVGVGAQLGGAILAGGLVLTVIHLVGIPLTGTSVNPARSIGPALFEPSALPQLWLFIVAPLVGAAVAFAVSRALMVGTGPTAGEADPTTATPGSDREIA